MRGIHNMAAIFCILLVSCCWDTKYGSYIVYLLDDQRGDAEYVGDINIVLHRSVFDEGHEQ